jgi:hypothetical protein
MKNKLILSSILALTLLGACKDSTTIVENEVGIIRGTVTLFDINGSALPDRSGAIISIQGTSYQTASQSNGDFQLNNIPAGIYTVIVTKPDYDTELTSSYQFSGAGTQFLQGEVIQAVPFDSLPIVSVSISSTVVKTDSNGVRDTIPYYGIHATSTVSGPDSTTLKYYEWLIFDATRDTGSDIINQGILASIPSKPIMLFDSSGSYYQYKYMKSGDTVYIETRAVGISPYSSNYPATFSPYIVRKKIILP